MIYGCSVCAAEPVAICLESKGKFSMGDCLCEAHIPADVRVRNLKKEILDSALVKIASALDRIATIEEKKFAIAHPPENTKREALISRPDDDQRKQFDDKTGADEWIEEIGDRKDDSEKQEKSRFQQRFEDPKARYGDGTPTQGSSSRPAKRKSRATRPVPKNK